MYTGETNIRCKICDHEDNNISYDKETKSFTDCGECHSAVQEALDDFADEDEEDEG